MRTDKEIKEQVDGLKVIAAKPTFRRTTLFHDNNVEAIEAQVEVLEHRLTEEDVFDRQDMGYYTEHVSNIARDAATWLVGDSEDTPVDGWKGLY